LNCLLEFRSKALDRIKKRELRIPYSDEEPDGFKAEPGLAADIGYVTAISSAFALALLEPESSRGTLLDPAKNLVLVHAGTRPQGEYAEIFKMPFDYLLGSTRRDGSCELCQAIRLTNGNEDAEATNLS
jgi:hypothetical protein